MSANEAPTPIPAIELEGHMPDQSQMTAVGSDTTGEKVLGGVTQLLLIFWAVLVIFPFLWMITSSFKTNTEILFSPWDLPSGLNWENFSNAWNNAHIGRYFLNSLIVIAMSLTLTLLISAMAAYVIARFEFPGNRALFFLFMAGLMFPVFLGLVPLYFLMDDLHIKDTYHGLALVYAAYSLPFTIFFLVGFFKTLPSEVAEAAIVDGASQYQVFFQIMLPMAKPGLIAMGIFNFLGQWNQYLLPLVLMQDEGKRVLSQGLGMLAIQQGYQNDYGALFAAMTITMVPTLIVYIIFQKRLESGLTAGALKG
ncbi:MAG: carbohydrate ABC transporter permease [Thermomicrobiales bacterium]